MTSTDASIVMRAVDLRPPEPSYDGLGTLALAFVVALALFAVFAVYVALTVGLL